MTLPRGRFGGTLAVAVAACLFGTLGPASRAAYDAGLTPLTFALWRAAVGTLGLLVIIAARTIRGRDRLHWKVLDRRTVAALAAAVSAGLVLNLAIFSAFGRMSIALALLGFYTYPALVAIGSVATGEEHLNRGRLTALALALLGMAVVVLGGSDGGPGFEAAGFGLALLAAAMQAVYVLLGRRGFPAVPTEEATLVVLGGTAAGFLLLTLATGSLDVALLPFRSPGALPVLLWAGLAGASIPHAPVPAGDPRRWRHAGRRHRPDRAGGRRHAGGSPPRRAAGSRSGRRRRARPGRGRPDPARRRGRRAARSDERNRLTAMPRGADRAERSARLYWAYPVGRGALARAATARM